MGRNKRKAKSLGSNPGLSRAEIAGTSMIFGGLPGPNHDGKLGSEFVRKMFPWVRMLAGTNSGMMPESSGGRRDACDQVRARRLRSKRTRFLPGY